ncbi:MAG: DUF126 domain-containing protein [Gemmatimonadaceae bacterium]
MSRWQATPIVPGDASGQLLRFERPISLWGGVDPQTGNVTDPRHPQHGACVAGRVIALPGTVGSSSSSYIMLELLASGCAPAAVILPEPDAILSLGVVVAREMGFASIPVVQLPVSEQAALPEGSLHVASDGTIAAVT